MVKYVLFVYLNYIQEDWSVVNKLGRFFLKPAWFVSSIIMWTYSTLFFPLVLAHRELKEIYDFYFV